MTTYYLRSTDGNDADDGSTWALAKAKMSGVSSIDAAGDTVYVSQAHAETTAAAVTLSFAGTATAPTKIICGDDAAEPPTAVASGGSIGTTGASNLTLNGTFYMRGVTMNCGNAAENFASFRLNWAGQTFQHYESCAINLVDTHPSSLLNIGSQAGGDSTKTKLTSCTLKLSNNSQYISLSGTVHIQGGGMLSGTSTPSAGLFMHGSNAKELIALIENFDFSTLSTGAVLFTAPPSGSSGRGGAVLIRNCKLPASWSGKLLSAAFSAPGWRIEMINCDSGNTNYKLWVEDYAGVIRQEATIVKTGGASDGTTALAWKLTSNANANELISPLASPAIVAWNDTTGSSKTVSVDIIHDSATNLTDAEVWLEVSELGTSSFPLGVNNSDKRATCLTTAADQAASSETWTTTGLTVPNKQTVSVTFTPALKGPFNARVMLGKASKTIYVDPVAQVT